MIVRHNCGLVLLLIASYTAHAFKDLDSETIATSVLSSPTFSDARQKLQELTSAEEGFQKRKSQPVLTRKSTIVGDVASGASDLTSRIHNARNEIETRIPEVIASVEKDIATSNRDKVILALANFLGMVFGILKATAASTNWADVSTGNKIQVFAQILYGYGYWGPFALEYEPSQVTCGKYDLQEALDEYGYVVHYEIDNLNPTIGTYFTTELNGKIKENLYCLIQRSAGNQDANELDTYIDVYTALLSEKISTS